MIIMPEVYGEFFFDRVNSESYLKSLLTCLEFYHVFYGPAANAELSVAWYAYFLRVFSSGDAKSPSCIGV